jgi:MurNAc alpha-1-phosphate uridylyltransferase
MTASVRFKTPGRDGAAGLCRRPDLQAEFITAGPRRSVLDLLPIWKGLAAEGRVHGVSPDGLWMHVGDPGARDAAEAKLK